MSLRAAASPLCPRLSPRARTIWSAAFAASTAAANPASEPHSPAGVLSGGSLSSIVQPCTNVVVRVLGLDAVEDRHRVLVLALAPPRAEHVVLVVAQRADHDRRLGRRRAGASAPSFLSRTIDLPAAVRAAARSSAVTKLAGSTALVWST